MDILVSINREEVRHYDVGEAIHLNDNSLLSLTNLPMGVG